jgi:type I restriction enzyme M protein
MTRDVERRANKSWSPHPRGDFAAGGSAYTAFDCCLDRLEAALPAGGILLLAIDELEQARVGIESGVLAAEVLAFLRSQMQHRERVVFLLCGSHGLLEPFWSPIVDLTARWDLGPLTYGDTTVLIRRPVTGAVAFEDAAIDAIWRHTAGHPYLVQSVCHRLVGQANRDAGRAMVGRSHVEAVIDQLADQGFFARLELADRRPDGSPHSPAQSMEILQ